MLAALECLVSFIKHYVGFASHFFYFKLLVPIYSNYDVSDKLPERMAVRDEWSAARLFCRV